MTAPFEVHTSILVGFTARPIVIRATATTGRPNLDVRGLPDSRVRETRVRVRSAIEATRPLDRSVTVDVPELPDGGALAGLDLAIAVAVLRASGVEIGVSPETSYVGELGFDGSVRGVRGALRHAAAAAGPIVIADSNRWEVGLLVPTVEASVLRRLSDLSRGALEVVDAARLLPHVPAGRDELSASHRAVFDACISRSRTLLVGSPGSGKTAIARRIAMNSDALDVSRGLEVVGIHGVAGLISPAGHAAQRPFRAPHHTCSEKGLVGDGRRPGEVSLAHRGVLFLDELEDFSRRALGTLAEVLDRGAAPGGFPASPTHVIAAANPCPCGYAGSTTRRCICPSGARESYEKRLSELASRLHLDRVDVPAVTIGELAGAAT